MENISLRQKYAPFFKQLAQLSTAAGKIDDTNVYQPGNPKTRVIMDGLVKDNAAPGSRIEGKENFISFFDQVCSGKHGLILMEHYSNMDLPAFTWLLEQDGNPKLSELAKRVVAIAGMKLNEADPMVKAFAESFTRVVIYPTRSLTSAEQKAQTEEEKTAEEGRARKINLAAMHAMDDCKRRGEVILVFPSGTRYRPGKPETKRGLREIDSYLRLFDYMLLVGINGNCLRINPDNPDDMLEDILEPGKVTLTAHPVLDCKKFREDVLSSLPADESDPKQKTVDQVMQILDEIHNQVESQN